MGEWSWSENATTRAFCQEAWGLVQRGELLDGRRWAGYVWFVTGVSTVYQCMTTASVSVGICKEPPGMARHWYRPVTEIAARRSRWDRAAGGNMARWILLLADEGLRTEALRVNGSLLVAQRGHAALVELLEGTAARAPQIDDNGFYA